MESWEEDCKMVGGKKSVRWREGGRLKYEEWEKGCKVDVERKVV